MEEQRMVVSFAPDGTETRDMHNRARVQTDAGVKELGLIELDYANDLEELEVKRLEVKKPDGRVIDAATAAQPDAPTAVARQAPMYTDQRSRQIPVKGLSPGDVVEEDVVWRGKKPLIAGQFGTSLNFTRNVIVLDATYVVRVPSGRKVTMYTGVAKPAESDESGFHVYTWHDSHREWTEEERKPRPRTHPKPPDVIVSSFLDWPSVGQWYWTLEKDRAAVTPEIQAKADELTKDAKTDDEKIEALYGFVSTNIRYIGISLGQGRYQPHMAREVLENQYGDCKDKHTLLAALLKAKGFDAEPVLIGTGPEVLAGVPSPSWFDHLITALPRQGKVLWMDTTPETAQVGLLMPPLYARQALAVREGAKSALVETPMGPDFPVYERFVSEGSLYAGKNYKGKLTLTSRGAGEAALRSVYRAASRAQWDQMTQTLSRGMSFAGNVSDIDVSSPEDMKAPFTLSYTYDRKNLGDGSEYLPPLMPPLGLLYGENDQRPADTIFLGGPNEFDYTSVVHLPAGKEVAPPPSTHVKTDFAEYSAKYSLADGVWRSERDLKLFVREIPSSRWDEYLKFEKVLESDLQQQAMLTDRGSGNGIVANGGAESLVRQAAVALRAQRWDEAEALLKEAQSENDRAPGLWRMYAGIELRRGNTAKSLEDCQREIEYHPDETDAYSGLARLAVELHRDDIAMATWHKLLDRDPGNEEGVRGLTDMLLDRKRSAEALEVAQKAVSKKPESAAVQLALERAQLATGQKDEGLKALQAAVKLDDFSETLNSAAYALVEADTGLDDAARWIAKAVQTEEAASARHGLDEVQASDFRAMGELAALWDTEAWVAYKSGSVAKAEEYARAAWILWQEPVVGQHYAEILAAQNRRDEAIRVLRVASGLKGAKQEVREALRKYAGPDAAPANGEALSRPRTFDVAWKAEGFESAEFNLLFAEGKLKDVRWVSGADALKPAADKIAQSGFAQPVPAGSEARIVRRGVLSCSSYTKNCMMALLQPDDVRN